MDSKQRRPHTPNVRFFPSSSTSRCPPAEVEGAAWFVACEALANATKHSGATHVWVRTRHTGGSVVLEIGDNGHGGADPAGSGLLGLSDRI